MKLCMRTILFVFIPVLSFAQVKGPVEQMRGMMPGVETMDNEKLIELLTDGIKQYPEQPAQYLNRGIAKYALTEYDSALVDINKTIALSPQFGDAYYDRGVVKMKLKDYKGAVEDFRFLIKNDTLDFTSLYNQGLAYYLLGNKDTALANLQRALIIQPRFEWALCNIGVIENEMGKPAEAIVHLTKAIEINPKDADYYYNRGQAYVNTKNKKLACEDFKKSADLGSKPAAEQVKSCE